MADDTIPPPPEPGAEPPPEAFHSPVRWANRLAFPLMVAAVLLAWQGAREPGNFPVWAWWTLAAFAAFFALLAVRLRHKKP